MNTRAYVVRISVGEVSQARIWNSAEPFQVGHPARWILEQTEAGVQIRNICPEAEELKKKAPSCFLRNEQVEKVARVALPEMPGVESRYQLEIQEVKSLPPAFATHPENGAELRIYSCRGDWSLGCTTVSSDFRGIAHGQKIFTLSKIEVHGLTRYRIKSHSGSLRVSTPYASNSQELELARGEQREFPLSALSGAVLDFGEFQWRTDILDPSSADLLAGGARVEPDVEDKTYRKAIQYAAAAIGLFILVSALWPKADKVLPPAEQKTKIVFNRKAPRHVKGLMTSAPKGDPRFRDLSIGTHGSTKNAGRKGARGEKKVAQRKSVQPRVAHVAKSQPKQVARASGSKRRPVVQARTTAQPRSLKRVAGLSQARPAKKAVVSPVGKPTQIAKARVKPGQGETARLITPKGRLAPQTSRTSALTSVSRGLLNGGMTSLVGRGRYSQAADGRAEARAILGGSSGLGEGAVPSNGRVGARSVEVASFGGGAGGAGGGGGDGGPGSAGAGYGRGSHAKVSGQGRSFVSLDTGASDVDDGLTRDQVGRVIHGHMAEIRYCYESAILRAPDAEGKLSVRFAIAPSGQVRSAAVAGSSVGDSSLDHCIVRRLSTWKFPKPRGGVDVAVTYPFIFKTLGR